MAEYVRFVSYLYEYQGNERKKNVGFVRYEVRAGQRRLTVSVNNAKCRDNRIPVYAFYREWDSCIGVALGTLVLRGGRGSFQYSTYAEGPGAGEPECRFEEIAGVVVMGEADTPVFCTVWDNEPFLLSGFVRCRQDLVRIRALREEPRKPEEEPESEEEPGTEEAPEPEEEPGAEKVPEPEEEPGTEEVQKPEEEPRTEEVPKPEEEPETEEAPESEEEPGTEEVPKPEAASKSEENDEAPETEPEHIETGQEHYALYRQSLWERLCKLYPKVMPFPYNCQIGALRIRPGDIGRLPKENWVMANNSFMLHGFFQYKYILLLRFPAQSSEYEERYMIAVPGTYSQVDQYLADMFGFHEFLGSPKEGNEEGYFGYFMQEVQMEQNG